MCEDSSVFGNCATEIVECFASVTVWAKAEYKNKNRTCEGEEEENNNRYIRVDFEKVCYVQFLG